MSEKTQPLHLHGTILTSDHGLRLDQALAKLFPQYSRARLQLFIKQQQVLVNGKILRAKDSVSGGEQIEINAHIDPDLSFAPEAIHLDIIYEDEQLLVLNKPVGIVVHPGAGNRNGTLLNALLHHLPQLATIPRAGIVHRLDKDTSGIMVVAKTLAAQHALVKQLQQRSIKREYLAIVRGTLTAGGTINAAMGRHPIQRTKMAIVASGRLAITHYRIKERFRAHTCLQVNLETGRTHQIRVHMAHLKHPIVGDKTYGGCLQLPAKANANLQHALQSLQRQALHAYQLTLCHPANHELVSFSAPVPQDLAQLLACLREDREDN